MAVSANAHGHVADTLSLSLGELEVAAVVVEMLLVSISLPHVRVFI